MLDIYSPLTKVLQTGTYGASFATGVGVVLSESPISSLYQIAGWDDFEDNALPILKKLGLDSIGDYQRCYTQNNKQIFRIAPDRVLIAANSAFDLPNASTLAILDLSHARTRIVIDGPAAEQIMARLAAIDFRKSSLANGSFVQTGIHHIGVLIHRTAAARFEILVPVTWARSIWDVIILNATSFGYEINAGI